MVGLDDGHVEVVDSHFGLTNSLKTVRVLLPQCCCSTMISCCMCGL